jgi:hypothetical protein
VNGRLLLRVVIISVIVRTESSYGVKFNNMVDENNGHCENRKIIGSENYYFVWW